MERRRIGLNLKGYEVFETSRGRCASGDGRYYFDRDQPIEHQARAPYFLARNLVQFAACAANVAYMIERGEVLSGAKLVQLHHDIIADMRDELRGACSLDRLLDEVEQALKRGQDSDLRDRSLALFRLWAREITEPAGAVIVEDAPILFVGIEGVITSQPSHFRGLLFDRNCTALLAQLASVIGAKIILTAPARLSWRGGADALWSAELWHDDWMLPAIEGRSTWQQLDAWLDGRDCEALIIDSQKNRYPGELADSIGVYYTYPPRGFEILDYHRILRRLGISDPKLPLPPPPAGTGFDHVPASWRGHPTPKPSSAAKAVPARGAGPSY